MLSQQFTEMYSDIVNANCSVISVIKKTYFIMGDWRIESALVPPDLSFMCNGILH